MKIANKPISALKPYPTNARTHSDAQIAKISASILEFGWTNPILIDPGGGTTIIAAEQTGWQQFTGKRAKLVSTGLEFPI